MFFQRPRVYTERWQHVTDFRVDDGETTKNWRGCTNIRPGFLQVVRRRAAARGVNLLELYLSFGQPDC